VKLDPAPSRKDNAPRPFPARPILLSVAAAFIVFAGMAGLTLAVDPFGRYETQALTGWDLPRPHARHLQRPELARQIAEGGIETLLIGTSRAYGLDAGHPALAGRAFTAAIPGANAHDLLRFIQHAAATNDLKRIVIGADFFSFNAYYQKSDAFDEALFAVDANGNPVPKWLRTSRLRVKALSSALTWDAFAASFDTLSRPSAPVPTLASVPEDKPAGHTESAAHQLVKIRYQERSFLNEFWFPRPRNGYSHTYPASRRTTLDDFETILALCREKGIALIVFFSPIHARLSYALNESGLWPRYEQWKTEMVTRLERNSGAEPPFAIWDFSAPHSITMEPIPAPDGQLMTWYQETSHYTKPAGNLLIDRILGRSNDQPIAEGFGRRLVSHELSEHFAGMRTALSEWARAHPEDTGEIAAVARSQNRCCRTW
jgi:hypothetical protein